MSKAYLLDTSAIFAFTDNEAGADLVQELLEKAGREQIALHISAMTAMEVYYVSSTERGEQDAHQLLLLVRALAVTELPLNDALIVPAARFKARYKISVADAWIAATAVVHNLTLVHKDPEFEPLDGVSLLPLPYKGKSRK